MLTLEVLEEARDGLWKTLEHLTSKMKVPVDREKSETWRSFYDLLPKHGMLLQHFGVGHAPFVWNIRQTPGVVGVFARLWGTLPEELLTSFDGFSFAPPPEVTRRGWFRREKYWLHVDQSYTRTVAPGDNFDCIQGLVTLWDVNQGDATLLVREGSHTAHAEFGKRFKVKAGINSRTPKSSRFYSARRITGEEFYPLRAVEARAGSLILWDWRTVHQGLEPQRGRVNRDRMRGAIYVCCTPRARALPKADQEEATLVPRTEHLQPLAS